MDNAQIKNSEPANKYKTFWPRFSAALLDGAALAPIQWMDRLIWSSTTSPLVLSVFVLFSSLVGLVYIIWFVVRFGMTPGKMVTGVRILDHKSEELPSLKQAVLRQIVWVLLVPIMLLVSFSNIWSAQLVNRGLGSFENLFLFGHIMMGWSVLEVVTMLFNRKRRAIHDFIGGTVVVRGRGNFSWEHLSLLKWGLIALFLINMAVPHFIDDTNIEVPKPNKQVDRISGLDTAITKG